MPCDGFSACFHYVLDIIYGNLLWEGFLLFFAAVGALVQFTQLSWRHRLFLTIAAGGFPAAFICVIWSFNPRAFDGHPHLTGTLWGVYVTNLPPTENPKETEGATGFAYVVPAVTIDNQGGFPSSVDSWRLEISTIDGSSVIAVQTPVFPHVLVNDPSNGALVSYYAERSSLADLAARAPIAAGGTLSGILLFTVQGVIANDLDRQGVLYTLTFTDIEGATHVLRYRRPLKPPHIPYLPGTDQRGG